MLTPKEQSEIFQKAMAGEAWLAGRRYKQNVKTTDFREYMARLKK